MNSQTTKHRGTEKSRHTKQSTMHAKNIDQDEDRMKMDADHSIYP